MHLTDDHAATAPRLSRCSRTTLSPPLPLQVVLELAKIIREDYLQQNAFSEHDFNCPLTKSVGMLRVIVQLYRRSLKAVTGSDATGAAASNSSGAKTITWNVIKATQSKLINRVTVRYFLSSMRAHPRCVLSNGCFERFGTTCSPMPLAHSSPILQDMKFLDPRTPDGEMTKYFGVLLDDINSSFDALMDM